MEKLYSINYIYTFDGNKEYDTWYTVKKNSEQVHKLMEHNRNIMLDNGMDILEYSFKEITVDGYDIKLIKK